MLRVKSPVKEASISVVVIRADGSREDRGVVSYYHKNPLRRKWFHLKNTLRSRQWQQK